MIYTPGGGTESLQLGCLSTCEDIDSGNEIINSVSIFYFSPFEYKSYVSGSIPSLRSSSTGIALDFDTRIDLQHGQALRWYT